MLLHAVILPSCCESQVQRYACPRWRSSSKPRPHRPGKPICPPYSLPEAIRDGQRTRQALGRQFEMSFTQTMQLPRLNAQVGRLHNVAGRLPYIRHQAFPTFTYTSAPARTICRCNFAYTLLTHVRCWRLVLTTDLGSWSTRSLKR